MLILILILYTLKYNEVKINLNLKYLQKYLFSIEF